MKYRLTNEEKIIEEITNKLPKPIDRLYSLYWIVSDEGNESALKEFYEEACRLKGKYE